MRPLKLTSDEFAEAASAAWRQARLEALKGRHPVLFVDEEGRDILEQPDGKTFEVRFLTGASGDSSVSIIRELPVATK